MHVRAGFRTFLAAAAACLIAAPAAEPGGGPPGAPPGGMPPRPVRTAPLVREEVRDVVEATGTVEPWIASVLATEVEGVVRTLSVREGDVLPKAGVPIATVSPEVRALGLVSAEARLAAARSARALVEAGPREEDKSAARALVDELDRRLAIAAANADRAEALASGDVRVMDQARADDLRNEAKAAAAKLAGAKFVLARLVAGSRPEEIAEARFAEAKAQADLDLAALEVERGTVRSPIPGHVVRLRTEVGQWVAKGGPIAEVVEIDRVLVAVGVGERDLPRVAMDADVTVGVDAYPAAEFPGKVLRVVPAADLSTRAFTVKVLVANAREGLAEEPLRPGMYARVRIAVGTARAAVLAPGDAVVTDAAGSAVYAVVAGKAQRIAVKRGPAHGARIEVTGQGLDAGTPVVVAGNEGLRDGDPVDATLPAVPTAPR